MTMDVRTALEYLKSKVDASGTCLLYTGFGRECSPCSFTNCMADEGHGTCGLRSIRTVLQNVIDREVASFIFQSDHQRIQNLETDMKKFREPFVDGTFSSLKAAVKLQNDELQRIRDQLFAIGKKGK